MYKIRLNKWGLQKYLRHQTPDSFKHGRRALGKQAEQFLDRALPVQQKRLSIVSVECGGTAITSPKPMTPRVLASPEQWRLPEECIFIAHNYLFGTFESRTWTPPANTEHSLVWIRQVAIGSNCLSRNMTDLGFSMLELCFANFRARLTAAEPHLLSDILSALAQLSRSSDELVDVFVNYALGLCTILCPINHPVRQLLSNLHKQGWTKIKPHLQNMLAAYWETARLHADPRDPYIDLQEGHITFLGTIAGWLHPHHAVTSIQNILRRRKLQGLVDPITDQQIHSDLVLMLYHSGQCEEAKSLALEMVESKPIYPSAVTNSHAILAQVAEKDGEIDEAIAWARKNFTYAMATWGPGYHRTAQTVLELILLLRKAEQIDEARQLVQIFDVSWEEFCKQLEKSETLMSRGKRFKARPSLLFIKGFHARFQQAFDEMEHGEMINRTDVGSQTPSPNSSASLSRSGSE
ncbi:uncharacterized protein B0I36DRAFT_317853 [Microdochium trichocladiopsis]|uniref:Clr5 domain-containing protein n=1 Tax=Microdochium trichocladiopsis TaxID=1682393 RepID=A0A9P9BWL8_9PEZI|nr:uncharacterized protein B0I36DRAFT_317853 [Microdochium trichocladiopsis]KAH7035206.1 hypothetical protein B0I36DRAFT_317853 [Microdochium trichocladiopsis]